jgi:hypothetical protein
MRPFTAAVPLAASLLSLIALAAGCVGQVAGSGSTSSSGKAAAEPCHAGDTESCATANGDVGSSACEESAQGTAWSECAPSTCSGDSLACTMPDSTPGVASCMGGLSASACGSVRNCQPGQTSTCTLNEGDGGTIREVICALLDGEWSFDESPCNTPLVLSFDDEPVGFTTAPGSFDLAGVEASIGTDWVSARTPWLAMDLDGNGRIDDGRELFGSMTVLPDGRRASNGFEALAALDDDGDGRITARDAAFARLLVWRDADQDRRSSPGELVPAGDAGIVAIHLDYGFAPRCKAGDCEIERARFVFRDEGGAQRVGAVVDVHLAGR